MAIAVRALAVTEGGGGVERARSSVDSSGVTSVRSIRCSRRCLVCSICAARPGTSRWPAVAARRTRARGVAGTAVRHAMRAPSPQRTPVRRGRQALPGFTTGEQTGWLAGLRDPIAGHALALLHDRPTEAWSLERLARAIGVSRSSLADRFSALIGQPPMRYLTRWRIQLACRLLCDDVAKVSAVAFDVGYQSEAAFSRAFKAIVGTSPATWRRRRQL